MGIVKVEKQIKVHKDGRVFEALALFDTGSRRSYFSKDFAEKIGYEPYKEPKDVPTAVKGQYAKVIGKAGFDVEISGYRLLTHGYVVEKLREPVIIGTSFMEEYELELDLKTGKVGFKKTPPEIVLI